MAMSFSVGVTLIYFITAATFIFLTSAPSVTGTTDEPLILLQSYRPLDSAKSVAAPKEFLRQPVYENEFVSKNGSDYILNSCTLISFLCRSKYPIKWKLPFPEQHLRTQFRTVVTSGRFSRFSETEMEPSNQLFRSILSIAFSNDSISVNMTCESVDGGYFNSVYLFVNGTRKIEREGETLVVNISTDNDSPFVVLPCRPTVPVSTLLLEKQYLKDNDEEEWRSLPDEVLQFSPKIGFTVDKTLIHGDICGLYRCRVEEQASVFVNVTNAGVSKQLEKFQPLSTFQKGGTVNLERRRHGFLNVTQFVCCSGAQDRLPSLYFEYCATAPECDIIKDTFISKAKLSREQRLTLLHYYNNATTDKRDNASGCLRKSLIRGSVVISCQDDNVDYFEHLVAPLPLVSAENEGVQESPQPYQSYNALPSLHKTQKMSVMLIGPRLARHIGMSRANVDLLGILKNITMNQTILFSYENGVYEGESIHAMCRGLKLFYSRGGRMRLNWKNGTKTVLPTLNNIIPGTPSVINIASYRDIGHTSYSVEVLFANMSSMSSEMESIDCFMPVWNSTGWDVISHKFDVLPTSPPKFLAKDDTVHFKQGESDKEISFEIEEFSPLPNIRFMGCGKRLTIGRQHDTNISVGIPAFESYGSILNDLKKLTAIIKFPSVTKAIECTYQCIARNLAGRAKQAIKVIVDYDYLT